MTLVEKKESFEKTSASHMLFYIAYIAFMFSIFAKNIFSYNISVTIILGLSVVVAVLGDKNEIIAFSISLMPLSSAFQYRYALLACIVIYVAKFLSTVKYAGSYIIMLAMFVWELLHSLSGDHSVFETFRQFTEIIFCVFVMSLSVKQFDFKLITRLVALSTAIAGLTAFLILMEENEYNIVLIMERSLRLGMGENLGDSYSMTFNSNRLGFLCNISICGLFYNFKLHHRSFFDILLLIIVTMVGILTLSRAFLLCFVFLLLAFALCAEKLASRLKALLIIVAFLTMLILILNIISPAIIETFIGRFDDEDVSNGRGNIFSIFNTFIFSSLPVFLFGIGMQNLMDKLKVLLGDDYSGVPHNGIQELFVVWGIVGVILVIIFIYTIIKNSKRMLRKKSGMNYIALLLILLYTQSSQFITSGVAMFSLTFAYIALTVPFNEKSLNC